MRKLFATLLTLIAVAVLTVTPTTAAYADNVCGNELDDWVPLLGSTWDVEAFVNGNPQVSVVTFTRAGQLAVTAVVDPLGVYTGQYAVLGTDELDWYAVDIPDAGPRLTYFATALTCGQLDNVLTASGPVVQYAVGQVGVFYATRVL